MSKEPNDAETDRKFEAAYHQVEKNFRIVEDYRRHASVNHKLTHIIFFTLCAVTAGANDLVGVDTWIKANSDRLVELFKLQHGTPSLSTLRLVYMLLDPEPLSQCFSEWVRSVAEIGRPKGISIDGKANRGTALPDEPNSAVHIVSAWASELNITLGHLKVDGKSNEITAIPKLLDLIDVTDTVVTIDAMGTQKDIANKILEQGGDYILALKGNQSNFHFEVKNFFDQALLHGEEGVEFKSFEFEPEDARGRTEFRTVYVATDWEFYADYKAVWQGLGSIVCIESKRAVTGKELTTERRYYISSLSREPQEMGLLIRGHWGIENGAHWILDVAFREDGQKARAGNIAENLSLIRRMSLNCLKQEKTAKIGVANKRLKAAYDIGYLLKVLGVKYSS